MEDGKQYRIWMKSKMIFICLSQDAIEEYFEWLDGESDQNGALFVDTRYGEVWINFDAIEYVRIDTD